jgi:transcriptional regulator with XRE-family HTH domain
MSGQWRPLPDTLPAEVTYLVGLLREFKDRSGLSLVALAEQTSYSKSSWERYVNGKTPPPRDAVLALARLVGEPVARPLALWERAQTALSGRTAEPQPDGGTAPAAAVREREPRPPVAARHRRRPQGLVIAAVAAVVAVVAFGVLARVVRPVDASDPSPPMPAYMVGCRGTQCDGREPLSMDCGVDAEPFAILLLGRTYLELSISDQCQAAWAQVSHSELGDQVEVIDRNSRTERATVVDEPSAVGFIRSPMIAAPRHSLVRACLVSRTGARQCTPWGAALAVPAPQPGRTVSSGVVQTARPPAP